MKDVAALGIPSRRRCNLLSINTTTTARVYYYLKRSRLFRRDRLEWSSFYLAFCL
jgi:hypothetical protein